MKLACLLLLMPALAASAPVSSASHRPDEVPVRPAHSGPSVAPLPHGQSDRHGHHGIHSQPDAASAPYAGLQQREIKALGDRQLADLRSGKGMSLALAAELNGYPGPAHVLEHAEALALTPQQRAHTQVLFDRMQAEAIRLAEDVIGAECRLDALFAGGAADAASVDDATARAGAAHARLRASHLRYHLQMAALLTAAQRAAYAKARGY
ncbi:hypothetical protein [Rhizobacter sp. LjRoot28]|uniref:hypothetical protein n=1 Tax=Rhizobacter sp. LjRoot28 TaxID=3342309 RepID=UPI003ECC76F0